MSPLNSKYRNYDECIIDKEKYRILLEYIKKLENDNDTIRAERDNFRAVLEGEGYQNLDKIASEDRDCKQIGLEAKDRTLAIINERDNLRIDNNVLNNNIKDFATKCAGLREKNMVLRKEISTLKNMIECPKCECGKQIRVERYGGHPVEIRVDCDKCLGHGTIPDRRKPTASDRALRHLLNKVNAVTAPHRHGQPISKRRLDDLANAQLEYEEAERHE